MRNLELVKEYENRFSCQDVEVKSITATIDNGRFYLNNNLVDDSTVSELMQATCYKGEKPLVPSTLLQLEDIKPGIFEERFRKYQKNCCTRERHLRLVKYNDIIIGVKGIGYAVSSPVENYKWFCENYGEPELKFDNHSYSMRFVEELTPEMKKDLQSYGVDEKAYLAGVQFLDKISGGIRTRVNRLFFRLACKNGLVNTKIGGSIAARHIGEREIHAKLFDDRQKLQLERLPESTEFFKWMSKISIQPVEEPMKLLKKYQLGKKDLVERTYSKYKIETNEFTGRPFGDSLATIVQTITDKYLNADLAPHIQYENAVTMGKEC